VEVEASFDRFIASALTFTMRSWRRSQTIFLNACAGHWKRCGGPHLGRGPLFAHPCPRPLSRTQCKTVYEYGMRSFPIGNMECVRSAKVAPGSLGIRWRWFESAGEVPAWLFWGVEVA